MCLLICFSFLQIVFQLAAEGKLEQLSHLCKEIPEVLRSRDRRGATTIHYAAQCGHVSVIDFIVGTQEGKECKCFSKALLARIDIIFVGLNTR